MQKSNQHEMFYTPILSSTSDLEDIVESLQCSVTALDFILDSLGVEHDDYTTIKVSRDNIKGRLDRLMPSSLDGVNLSGMSIGALPLQIRGAHMIRKGVEKLASEHDIDLGVSVQ